MRTIARRLDLNFKTVRRYIRAVGVDAPLAGGIQVSVLEPFKPCLNDRLADDERNATRLLAEITGLRRDLDAVVAGLTMGYDSGAVEGTVNRIKQLKAAMCGRAEPDLLRKLILLA